jgi:hypothetical protein
LASAKFSFKTSVTVLPQFYGRFGRNPVGKQENLSLAPEPDLRYHPIPKVHTWKRAS